MIRIVTFSLKAEKQLVKAPKHVISKLKIWSANVESLGLEDVRKQPGYHDEPLKGKRRGQRSIRINRLWRAIYEIQDDGGIEFVSIQEVTPHDY